MDTYVRCMLIEIALVVIWSIMAFIVYPAMISRRIEDYFTDAEKVAKAQEISHSLLIPKVTGAMTEALSGLSKTVRDGQNGAIGSARRWMASEIKEGMKSGAGVLPQVIMFELAESLGVIKPKTAQILREYMPLIQSMQQQRAANETTVQEMPPLRADALEGVGGEEMRPQSEVTVQVMD